MFAAIAALGAAGLGLYDNYKNRQQQKRLNSQNINNDWAMWNANNAFNNPLEQRRRMEAAGFNPNLMYGNGSVSNTSSPMNISDAQMAPSKTSDAAEKGFTQYFDTKMKSQTVANAEAQNELLKAQVRKTNTEADILGVNYGVESDPHVIDAKKLIPALNRMILQNKSTISANEAERSAEKIANDLSIQLGIIKNQGATLTNAELEADLKRSELKLRQNGLSWTDPVLMRLLAAALPPGVNLQTIIQSIKSSF